MLRSEESSAFRIFVRFCLVFLLNAFFESRFLKDKGLSFHNLAPILEKEFAWMDSLECFM